MSTSNKPLFRVVSVYQCGDKDAFTYTGAAWPSKPGGFVLRLQALPLGNTILLCPREGGK